MQHTTGKRVCKIQCRMVFGSSHLCDVGMMCALRGPAEGQGDVSAEPAPSLSRDLSVQIRSKSVCVVRAYRVSPQCRAHRGCSGVNQKSNYLRFIAYCTVRFHSVLRTELHRTSPLRYPL